MTSVLDHNASMPRFTATLRNAYCNFDPDQVDADTLSEAIVLARAETLRFMESVLGALSNLQAWRLEIRDATGWIMVEVPLAEGPRRIARRGAFSTRSAMARRYAGAELRRNRAVQSTPVVRTIWATARSLKQKLSLFR
jgi:hypothetical protein